MYQYSRAMAARLDAPSFVVFVGLRASSLEARDARRRDGEGGMNGGDVSVARDGSMAART